MAIRKVIGSNIVRNIFSSVLTDIQYHHNYKKLIMANIDILDPFSLPYTKEELLNMDYTTVLRSNDPDIREAALKHLKIRKVPINTKYSLRPHQIEVLQWLDERERNPYMGIRGGIVAVDMGLGKTLCATVHALSRERGRNPSLIVCSKTLIANWKTDLEKFFGADWVKENVIFLHRDHLGVRGIDQITREQVRSVELVITAYPACASAHQNHCNTSHYNTPKELENGEVKIYKVGLGSLKKGLDILYSIHWTRIILDESQNIANHNTATYSAVCALKGDKKICLTGTPLRNVDGDVLSQFIFLGINPEPARRAWDFQRFRNLGLDAVLLTMNYDYAGIKLPEKDDVVISIKMTEREREVYTHIETRARDIYNEMERGLVEYSSVLEVLLRLRQFCVAPYLTTRSQNCSETLKKMGIDVSSTSISQVKSHELGFNLARWLTDKEGTAGFQSSKTTALITILEGLCNKKVAVFSQFSGYLNLLSELLTRIGRPHFVLDGSVKTKDRAEMIRKFNEDDKPWVLLLNYKIGGEGLNLQICSEAIFTDQCWNAASRDQAKRRFWRAGQDNQVHCYHLVTENSVETRMYDIVEEKGELLHGYLNSEGKCGLDRNVAGRILDNNRWKKRQEKEHKIININRIEIQN